MTRISILLSAALFFGCSGSKDDTAGTNGGDSSMAMAATCADYCSLYLTNCTDTMNEYAAKHCGLPTEATVYVKAK